eukprot:11576231-Alexandrium_andersonii.AAC.1
MEAKRCMSSLTVPQKLLGRTSPVRVVAPKRLVFEHLEDPSGLENLDVRFSGDIHDQRKLDPAGRACHGRSWCRNRGYNHS